MLGYPNYGGPLTLERHCLTTIPEEELLAAEDDTVVMPPDDVLGLHDIAELEDSLELVADITKLPPGCIKGLLDAAARRVLAGFTSPATTVAMRTTSSSGSLS